MPHFRDVGSVSKEFTMVDLTEKSPFQKFTLDLQKFAALNPNLIENTLSNIFTMRLLGNKTHGDLAEIGITEFINQFLPGYEAQHVGKDLFRAKLLKRIFLLPGWKISLKLKFHSKPTVLAPCN